MAILRIGWLCRSGYEFHQHTRIGKDAGLSDAEIERLKSDADAAGWTEAEAALLRAVDDLHGDQFISDATWQRLSKHYDTRQVIDLVFAVGQYTLVSMAPGLLGVIGVGARDPRRSGRRQKRWAARQVAAASPVVKFVVGAGTHRPMRRSRQRAPVRLAREGTAVACADRDGLPRATPPSASQRRQSRDVVIADVR
jgi:hypothetical protein